MYPGATEYCDEIDNDCDAEVDEAAVAETISYPDNDGDGFGDESAPDDSCTPPADYVIVGGDCDDEDPLIKPDAIDTCDEVDNDCDGTVDEDPEFTWYVDSDEDGYGLEAVAVDACEVPDGFVDNSDDCEDEDPAINPDGVEICDGFDNNCDGETDGPSSADATTWYMDLDGDGYGDPAATPMVSCDVISDEFADNDDDCNDDDAAMSPGADETCDSVDNDCDGVVDEDATDAFLWYVDADDDGFGIDDEVVEACDEPDGFAASNDDCDDTTATVNPGASEACNEIDDDCNGLIDDDASETFYADADGDGYGDPDVSESTCEPSEGYVSNGEDCDDTSPDISPDADEVCDGVDNDCDESIDIGASDMVNWYFDDDGDGYGGDVVAIVACSADGGLVDNSDDCNDGDIQVFPGADEMCNGADDDCDDEIDEDAVDPITFYVDSDGDGYGTDTETTEACDPPDGFASNSDDCNDESADISPGAVEVCDEIDNDCDADIDEDVLTTYYIDRDDDGFGDGAGTTMLGCEPDPGFAENVGDCDDLDETVYPDADEYCNGIDDDCDDEIDEVGVVDGTTFYRDADEDGYGDIGDSLGGCAAIEGYVENSDDCDDADDTVYPDATELCDDIDNDCNGAIDDEASETWYLDLDEDGFGIDSDTYEGCEPPDGYVNEGGDCDDDDMFLSPGELEVCDGVDNNCDGEIDEDDEVLGSSPDCAAIDCDDIITARTDLNDGTYFFTDGTTPFAGECDFGNPPEPVDWSSQIKPMINMYCTGCHSSSSSGGGLNLRSLPYYRLVDEPSTQVPSMDRVEPFSASNSYLWHKLMGTHTLVGGSGSTMPTGEFMPPEDRELWTNWINAGADN